MSSPVHPRNDLHSMQDIPRLWLCADELVVPWECMIERITAIVPNVRVCIWYRCDPKRSGGSLRIACELLGEIAHRYTSMVVVSDRLDVALCSAVDGVHLSRRSMTAADVRRCCDLLHRSPSLLISSAVHDEMEIHENATDSDVCMLSPFREVENKRPALGIERFSKLAHAAAKPCIALGGIVSAEHAQQASQAGAYGICIRRGWVVGNDPVILCQALLRGLFDGNQPQNK